MGVCFNLFLISSLMLQSCENKHSAPKHIALSMREDPRSLDPREVRLLADINLIKQIYEGLVQENPQTKEIEPALAKSFTISEDKMTYTFHLRKAFWSNGDPITAYDFVDSWKQVVTQEVVGIYAFAFAPLKNITKIQKGSLPLDHIGFEALDKTTLKVSLEQPTSHFLRLLSLPIYFPTHASQRNSHHSQLPITSGAFFPKETKQKQWLTLFKNPYYYKQDQVKTQTIKIHFVPDSNTASLLFNQGKLNWLGPPWGDRIPLEAQANLQTQGYLHVFDVAATSWLVFNTHKFPLNHQKLRQALAFAIDKDIIVSSLFIDAVKPAQHLIPHHIHSYPEETSLNTQQRKILAKKLFNEALEELQISPRNFENLCLSFSAGASINPLLAQLIRHQWKETFGFTIPLSGKEFSLLQEDLASKNFSFAIGGWYADFSDPMAFLSIFTSGISPYTIDNQTFLNLVSTIQHEHDYLTRQSLVSQAAIYLESLHIVEPIYHDSYHFALNKKFSNLEFSSTGTIDLRYTEES